MANHIITVQLKDLKTEQFINAVKSGKVKWEVEELTDEQISNMANAEIRIYTNRIREYARSDLKKGNRIESLWEKILTDECLGKKPIYLIGKKKGRMKFSGLIALVAALSRLNIYWESPKPLYRMMQQAPETTNDFYGSGAYKLKKEEEKRLEKIIKELLL